MNKWECDFPGCTLTAVGCGGAIGLRAIGWFFDVGPHIRCPAHRPDPIRCVDIGAASYIPESAAPKCGICAGDKIAKAIQDEMKLRDLGKEQANV